MSETYSLYRYGRPVAKGPAPGLLLSLGDGTAVEANDEMIKRAVVDCTTYRPGTGAVDLSIDAFKHSLIQQAQEARDA